MSGIFDYFKWRGDLSLLAVPLCDADLLIFSELVYIDLCADTPQPLPELCRTALKKQGIIRNSGARQTMLHHKQDEELLSELAKSPRFADVKIGYCESRTDKNIEEQFGAMTVFLPDDSLLIVFRGTDWSLVGWKEDFNMAYCEVLPAQKSALEYLTRIAVLHSGPIYVTGHSKGGNLAVYASAFAPDKISSRIISVTSLDGPGFNEKILSSPQYGAISERVRTFMPSASIVGTLFSHTGKFSIIKSRGRGVMQHIPYNWEIVGGGFVTAAERDGTSQLVEVTLNEWIAELTAEERRTFIDTVWSVLSNIDIDDLVELLEGKNTKAIIKNYNALDEDSKKLIGDTLAKLRECAKGSLSELVAQTKKK